MYRDLWQSKNIFLHRSAPINLVDYFRWLTLLRKCHKCHLSSWDPQTIELSAQAQKAVILIKKCALHWIATASQMISLNKNTQLSIKYFFSGSYFPGALRDPTISLVLYHPLLHETDTGLPQNKNVLFCQTFIVECNTSIVHVYVTQKAYSSITWCYIHSDR